MAQLPVYRSRVGDQSDALAAQFLKVFLDKNVQSGEYVLHIPRAV